MTILWALLVGIDNYAVDPLDGSGADVQHMYEYLVQDRNVPPENIRILRDEEATRAEILAAFEQHLIENPAITRGDPILFHFSGHGTSEPIRTDWVGARTGEHFIEHIVPFDAVFDPEDPDAMSGVQPAIPDRTLNALLRRLARAKGDNITVTFDCCHSAHATRSSGAPKPQLGTSPPSGLKPYKNRGIKYHKVGRTRPDTDAEILHAADAAPLPVSGGDDLQLISAKRGAAVSVNDDKTHVLLAACGREQEAAGNLDGGVFTNHLLEVLRQSGGALSNREAIERVRDGLAAFYKQCEQLPPEWRPDRQDPTYFGRNGDRPLFQSTHVKRGTFDVRDGPDPTQCTILAGATAGVTPGTIFELMHFGQSVGTAVATRIGPGSCLAKLPDGIAIQRGMQARLTSLAEPLKTAVINTNTASVPSTNIYNTLVNRLQMETPDSANTYNIVDRTEDADLVLAVDEAGVELQRRRGPAALLNTANPRVRGDHVARIFPQAMKYFSLFNFYLAMDSPEHPISSNVGIHFHTLVHPDGEIDDDMLDDVMSPGEEIQFSPDGEVQVIHEEGALYALVLKNHTPHPLFPYVIFFDPASYTIQLFYEPSTHEAPLEPYGEIQLGRSAECMAAVFFTLDENDRQDTGFLKIIFATEPLSLKFMEQDAALGVDEYGRPKLSSMRNAKEGRLEMKLAKPLRGAWDTVLRRVTVLPPPV